MTRHAVEIANPLPGGMEYTSPSRAQDYINMGIAYMVGNKLQFDEEHQVRKQVLRSMTFWNGSDDPRKQHRPGEVRC